MRTAINNHSTRSLVEKHTTQATKILRGILMPKESTCMLFIIMMLQCPCMQARRDSPPRSPNATGSVAVQDSHRPVRPSTGSTAGGPTDADVDAHQETCSRECDTKCDTNTSMSHRHRHQWGLPLSILLTGGQVGVNPERQPSLSRWGISAVSLAWPAYMDIATS